MSQKPTKSNTVLIISIVAALIVIISIVIIAILMFKKKRKRRQESNDDYEFGSPIENARQNGKLHSPFVLPRPDQQKPLALSSDSFFSGSYSYEEEIYEYEYED